jgi:hypothetical protein
MVDLEIGMDDPGEVMSSVGSNSTTTPSQMLPFGVEHGW